MTHELGTGLCTTLGEKLAGASSDKSEEEGLGSSMMACMCADHKGVIDNDLLKSKAQGPRKPSSEALEMLIFDL